MTAHLSFVRPYIHALLSLAIGLVVQCALHGQEPPSPVVEPDEMPKTVLRTDSQLKVKQTVDAAHQWLVKQQQEDGAWSLVGPYSNGGQSEDRVAATALALLALVSSGTTHQQGEYQEQVKRGLKWLLDQQDDGGYFYNRSNVPSHHRAYAQAISSFVVCELYSVSKDNGLRPAALAAIQCAENWQSPEGGWRYAPGRDSDTSVTGWFFMIMHSGKKAGLAIKPELLEKASEYLDAVQRHEGAAYAYQVGREASFTPTAEGLLCRQLSGWKSDNAALTTGIQGLGSSQPFKDPETDVYGWYFATLAMERYGEPARADWTIQLRNKLFELQKADQPEQGSWSPKSDSWGDIGGRLVTTCFAIANLTAYYRHLPLYQVETEAK